MHSYFQKNRYNTNSWKKIWESEPLLNRAYTTANIEVYGEKASDPTNGEADIFIAVN